MALLEDRMTCLEKIFGPEAETKYDAWNFIRIFCDGFADIIFLLVNIIFPGGPV